MTEMTPKEKELYTLLAQYRQYSYELDQMLQGLLDEHFPQAYADLKQKGLLLEERMKQVSAPAQG